MKSTVETLGPTRARLAIEVPCDELEPGLTTAYRQTARQAGVTDVRGAMLPFQAIDQRHGATVLPAAVQGAILAQIHAAGREHGVQLLGRPQVDITEFCDGRPLVFTALVDIRPRIILPELSTIAVAVDPVAVTDAEIDERIEELRQRFATRAAVDRPVATGDVVRLDLTATLDGTPVQDGGAEGIDYEVGSGRLTDGSDAAIPGPLQLLAGLDEALAGLSAGESVTVRPRLLGRELAGKDAAVAVTVKAVDERRLPELDAALAALAGPFGTLEELRGDLRERLTRDKKATQLRAARNAVLEELITIAAVPAPEAVVRDEVDHRHQWMLAELRRIGTSLSDYLTAADKSEQDVDAELRDATSQRIRIQLVLDAFIDAEAIQVTNDEFSREITRRARHAGTDPRTYYDRMVRADATAAVHTDARRAKALDLVMRRVIATDTDGNTLTFSDLTATDLHERHDRTAPRSATAPASTVGA